MFVRSDLPGPLRSVVVVRSLGLSAAIVLWAFEFGKDIAGADRRSKFALARLGVEVAQLPSERDQAQTIVNASESLMRVEILAHDRRVQQLRRIEADSLEPNVDLGFFLRPLPAGPPPRGGLCVRRGHARIARQDTLPASGCRTATCRPSSRGATTSCWPVRWTAVSGSSARPAVPGCCSCGNLSATPNIKTRGRAESLARPDRRRMQTICFTLKCRLPLPSVECEGTVVQC